MKTDQNIEITHYPSALIDPSPYQTRKHFDEVALQGLSESLKEDGFIQPLVARVSTSDPARLELIAGERRLRAAKMAGIETVPVIVRDLSDLVAREIVIIENLQREDLTVTEEARGYRMALDLKDVDGRPVYTQASLAAKLKKNESYIADRLKLLECPQELIQAVEEGLVALSTAMLVGRIPDSKERAKAAKEVLKPSTQEVPLNFEQTREMIREKYMVSLGKPGFDLEAEGLVPIVMEGGVRIMGGSCVGCPFCMESGTEHNRARNSETAEQGGELLRKSGVKLCTLPPCFRKKQEASWAIVRRHAEEQGLKVIEGDAARRMFYSWNGELADDCGYVALHKRPEAKHVGWQLVDENKKTWGTLLKGTDVATVIVRHPTSGQRIEVADAKEATVIAKAKITGKVKEKEVQAAAKEAAAELGLDAAETGGKLDPAALAAGIKSLEDAEAARKAQRKEELRQQKIEHTTLHEGLTDLAEAIGRKGMDAENLEYLFQVTLENSGADGFKIMKEWLGLKMPPGTASSARDYEEDILKTIRKKATTPFQWLGYIVVATLAKTLRWNGLENEDMQELWKRYGIKQKELERRAVAIVDAGKKGAKVVALADDDEPELNLRAESGPSVTELLTGVQDSKQGRPGFVSAAGSIMAAAERGGASGSIESDEIDYGYTLSRRKEWLLDMLSMPIEATWPNVNQVFNEATEFAIEMPSGKSGVHYGHAITVKLACGANGSWYSGYAWDRPALKLEAGKTAATGDSIPATERRKHATRFDAVWTALCDLSERFCEIGEDAAEDLIDTCLEDLSEKRELPKDASETVVAVFKTEADMPKGEHFCHCDGCGKVCDVTGFEQTVWAMSAGEFRCSYCADFTRLRIKVGGAEIDHLFVPLPPKQRAEFEQWNPADVEEAPSGAFDVDEAAQQILGGKSYPEVIGEERPAEGTPERKAWEAKKVKIWKVVQKLKKAA